MSSRYQQLQDWLSQCAALAGAAVSQPVPASSDASFRRYFRIDVARPHQPVTTAIIMDAPPQHEDCEPFVRIADQLSGMGLTVPEVLEQDVAQGFLLLRDLGTETYLNRLSDDTADSLYSDALQALVQLQTRGHTHLNTLPNYDAALLTTEMNLFTDWLLARHLNLSLNAKNRQAWQNVTEALTRSALRQPKVYVHRDFHSRNLMVQPVDGTGNPGILDFQDAVQGPLTYDAVSLLRDCYVSWPPEQVVEWQRQYFLRLVQAKVLAKDEWKGFVKAMDLMGVQRHLKAAGIFARLFHRDGKDGYLNDIPNTVDYLMQVAPQYAETRALMALLEETVYPAMQVSPLVPPFVQADAV
ncbi:MAG: aminoglycoside phosphotransferase family protein [Hydrogenovibrio sp.]